MYPPLPESGSARAKSRRVRRRYSIGTLSARTNELRPMRAASASAAARSGYAKIFWFAYPGSPTLHTIFMRTGGFGSRAFGVRFGFVAAAAFFSAFSFAVAAASAAFLAMRSEFDACLAMGTSGPS
jgi:hypothetical protein